MRDNRGQACVRNDGVVESGAMRAKEQTLGDLLAGRIVRVTPSFQRPYGGSDDIVAATVAAAVAAGGRAADAPPELLGGLVTRELAGRDGVRKALLVDGNQRLATLLLILLALRDRLRETAPDAAVRLDESCFLNPDAPAPLRFKYLAAKADRAAFEAAASGASFPDPAHPMARAAARAAAAFAPLGAAELSALARRLPSAFSFIVFDLAPDDDPYPVFKLFNARDDRATRIGRDVYGRFSSDPELMDLVAGGESQEVEFKAHGIVTAREGKKDAPRDVATLVRAIAAMLNGPTGGTILVGVADDGDICGIEDEYPLADRGKSNWDGWQLRLANTLRTRLSARNAFLHCAIERRRAGAHDVCLIRVTPSDEPVYIDKRLFVRTFNQTVELLGPDLVDYVARRFPPNA